VVVRDFRELRVREKGHRLTRLIYEATGGSPGRELYGLMAQLRRCSASIPANIAEGCGRSGDAELGRLTHPETRPTRRSLMDTPESSAPDVHPSTEDHDDTVETHHACLECPCACIGGWVFVGYKTSTARTGKPPTGAVTARIADSPTPMAYADTSSDVPPAARYREQLHDSHEQEENIRKETNPSVEPRRQVSVFALGAILGVRFILNSLRPLECLAQGHVEEGGEGWKETRL
jgi:hypothetical protein